MSAIILNIVGNIATITLNRPETYNALTPQDYDDLGETLRIIDKRDDVLVTVLQANGKYFCTGTNVSSGGSANTVRSWFLSFVTRANTDVTHALYTHRKILVAALNGPVLGIAAAYLGHFDFIYALPSVWMLLPFPFLGLVSEGGSSVTLVEKLGPSLANEALILGKKLSSEDLSRTRFINKIFPDQDVASFHKSVHAHLLNEFDGLDPTAVLKVKGLIKAGQRERNPPESANLRESYAQAEQMDSGVPARRFAQFARKEIRHKL